MSTQLNPTRTRRNVWKQLNRANPPKQPKRPFSLIGELMNNSFARSRRAWAARDLKAFQHLAQLQTELGADFLTLNLDGTQTLMVRPEEMLAFLPDLIPAIQEVTDVPISFDNPAIEFHRKCLEVYDPSISGRPIFNSLAASRENLDEMLELIAEHDTLAIVMASERFDSDAPYQDSTAIPSVDAVQCYNAKQVYESTKYFVHLLRERAGRTNDQIIVDPGLAPVSADTYGLVNMGLDAIGLIRDDADLAGVHISVGLTNFSFGVPREIREGMENAYLTLAVEKGLDFVLGNPEKDLRLLDQDDRYVQVVSDALELGRPVDGETQEDAGFRQSEKIMDLF